MRRMLIPVGLIVFLFWAVGCGDEGGSTGSVDAEPDAGGDVGGVDVPGWYDGTYGDGAGQGAPENCIDGVDNDEDGAVDCADDECAERLACDGTPNPEQESNQTPEQAQSWSLPMFVSGRFAEYTEDGDGRRYEDNDWFLFQVNAPTVVRLAFDDVNGLALPSFRLVGLSEQNDSVVRWLDGDAPGQVREAFLPYAGVYGVEARDRRNPRSTVEEFPYGGDGYDYVLRVEAVELSSESASLPIDSGLSQLEAGNSVVVLEVDLTAGEVFEAEVMAERLAPSSGLDSMLYLIDADNDDVLAFNDDAPLSTFDPFLRTGILEESTEALLVLDAYRIEFTTDYELRADSHSASQDREPNSPIGLAYPSVAGTTIDGGIAAPFQRFRSLITDTDYYVFPGGRSASYVIDVTPTGGNVNLAVRTGWQTTISGISVLSELFRADPPEDRAARIEASSLVTLPLVVVVTDRRNTFDDETDPVGGGDAFGYELEVTELQRDIAPVELPLAADETLTQLGEVDWYEFDATGRSRLEATASFTEDDVEAFLYLAVDNDGFVRRDAESFYHLINVDRTYRLAVAERRSASAALDYQLDVGLVDYNDETEVEPNDGPPVGAQVLGELPVWVDGTLDGEDEEDFDVDVYVVTLQAGTYVTIETAPGIDLDTDNADTMLQLEGPSLSVVTDDDDGFGNAARLQAIEVLETGAHEITVTPWCDDDECRGGDYSLAIWTVPAPPVEE